MGVQKVRKYHGAEHAVAAVGTTASSITFSHSLSAVQVAVNDGNAIGSPVFVRLDNTTATAGSGYPVFDGTSDLFEVRLSPGETLSAIYSGSPTTTANVHVIGYYHTNE